MAEGKVEASVATTVVRIAIASRSRSGADAVKEVKAVYAALWQLTRTEPSELYRISRREAPLRALTVWERDWLPAILPGEGDYIGRIAIEKDAHWLYLVVEVDAEVYRLAEPINVAVDFASLIERALIDRPWWLSVHRVCISLINGAAAAASWVKSEDGDRFVVKATSLDPSVALTRPTAVRNACGIFAPSRANKIVAY